MAARTHARMEEGKGGWGGGSAVATRDPVFFPLARMCNLCVGLVRSSLGCVCTVYVGCMYEWMYVGRYDVCMYVVVYVVYMVVW